MSVLFKLPFRRMQSLTPWTSWYYLSGKICFHQTEHNMHQTLHKIIQSLQFWRGMHHINIHCLSIERWGTIPRFPPWKACSKKCKQNFLREKKWKHSLKFFAPYHEWWWHQWELKLKVPIFEKFYQHEFPQCTIHCKLLAATFNNNMEVMLV